MQKTNTTPDISFDVGPEDLEFDREKISSNKYSLGPNRLVVSLQISSKGG